VVVVAAGNDEWTSSTERWGSLGNTQPLMHAVKSRFDPHHILNANIAPWD